MTLTVRLIQTPLINFFSTAGIGYMKKLKKFTLAETQGTQRFLLSVGATLVANYQCSRLKSLLRRPVNPSAFSAPLRENRMLYFPLIRVSHQVLI
jgi:hypothetical protein